LLLSDIPFTSVVLCGLLALMPTPRLAAAVRALAGFIFEFRSHIE
jgi:hypothetical protein